MTSTEPAVRMSDTETTVPAPRPSPHQERTRRRHDGYYWDVSAAGWRPCPGR